jgi:ComF family protein
VNRALDIALDAWRLAGRSVRAVHDLLAPNYCAACDAPLDAADVFCASCGPCPPPLGALLPGVLAAGAYAPPLSTAILRMKFGPRADIADRLAALLPAGAALDPSASADAGRPLVVPVPLHQARLVERGFNPSALLGRQICRRSGAHFAPDLLQRNRDTPQQSHLSARARRKNVSGAFVATTHCSGGRVILLDDVVTTGSTVEACRQALYAAGVLHVTVVALAAALPP